MSALLNEIRTLHRQRVYKQTVVFEVAEQKDYEQIVERYKADDKPGQVVILYRV